MTKHSELVRIKNKNSNQSYTKRKMDSLIKQLRQIFLMSTIPSVAFFCLFYFAADEPLVSERMHFTLMVIMLLMLLVGVLALHFYLKHAEKKCIGKPWKEQKRIFGGAYKFRIVALNIMLFIAALLYLIVVDMNCVYSAGMLALLILLSYPTKQFLSNGINSTDTE